MRDEVRIRKVKVSSAAARASTPYAAGEGVAMLPEVRQARRDRVVARVAVGIAVIATALSAFVMVVLSVS
ncbi:MULTISPECIES: hypothetical protein [unclassified Curtobacterium]|uniref:hypothetical protein n=1 Tax=unclassified Curtobacterium TaxID=257496 RepID=UPI001042E2D0|nr:MULTISPECIES: hypothetical protein [unclassified Curtobacterium]